MHNPRPLFFWSFPICKSYLQKFSRFGAIPRMIYGFARSDHPAGRWGLHVRSESWLCKNSVPNLNPHSPDAKVVTHGRYVAFQMAEVAIPRDLFADILRMIAELRPPPLASTA